MIKYAAGFCFALCTSSLLAQDSAGKKSDISWNVFLDAYYSFDFSKPANHQKASFFYNHNRHNEININLALVNFSYNDSFKRANFALMAGTYAQYNLASEPALLRNIYAANIGIRISRTKAIWIDAGILPSHIGFESAVSKDCRTLTRSLAAENSPYYEAGVRTSYSSPDKKWYGALLLLNGWQRIRRKEGNHSPSFGTQVMFTPSDKFSINSSSFIGNDQPDSSKKMRYFHNLYGSWNLSTAWSIIAGFDFGMEQKGRTLSGFNYWHSPQLILRYTNNHWAFAARAEYFSDPNGVIISAVNDVPVKMQGYSLNVDRSFPGGLLFRIEGKYLKNQGNFFYEQNGFSSKNLQLTSSLSFGF